MAERQTSIAGIPIDSQETFARGRRIKILLDLTNGDDDDDQSGQVIALLMALLEHASHDGFHTAEIEMLFMQKDH